MAAEAERDQESAAKRVRRLERRMEKRRQKLAQMEKERRRLKWFVVLAFVTGPIGFVWAWWAAAWIFFGWLTFFAVGAYLNYFHVREAKRQLDDAERELEEAQEALSMR